MNQQVRFCRSFDGTRIAYAATGEGPPLVKAPHWLTHLEYELQSPIWRPWIAGLSRGRSLVRLDERGCGLSDRGVGDISFEAFVRDLEAEVDAAGLERFALLGHSQGGPERMGRTPCASCARFTTSTSRRRCRGCPARRW